MTDQKIENLLNLALDATMQEREKSLNLNVGFDADFALWDVIVKYSGDIRYLENETIKVVPLLNEYAVITIPQKDLEYLSGIKEIEYIEKPKRLYFAVNEGRAVSCITGVQNAEYDLFGQGVLVAVIDSGADYTHPDFRNEDGSTRILALWDQTILPEGELTGLDGALYKNEPPEGYRIGVEYKRERINAALAAGEYGEELVPSRDLSGHGTGVLGIAAGNGRASAGRYKGVASQSDILVVKLGNPRQGPEGFPKTTELMQGVDYVIRKALELNRPVAVNISFGNTYGSHDGTSLLSRYLDDVANIGRSVICVGTGNEGAAAGHTAGIVTPEETAEVLFSVGKFQPAFNIQLWKSYVDEFDVLLESPGGMMTGPLSKIPGAQRFRAEDTELLVYYGEPSPGSAAQEIYIDFLPVRDYVASGQWRVLLIPRRIVQGNFDMWMPSGAVLNSGTGFLFPVEETTLTVPSGSFRVISVGAYDSRTDAYAEFSGRGYTRVLQMVKPELVAPGVEIITTVPGGGYRQQTGTSFATPFVTGAAALLMQYGIVDGNDPFLYGEKVKAKLIRGARHLPGEDSYPNKRFGWGALCLRNSI